MALLDRSVFLAVLMAVIFLTTPGRAQTGATLNISARVVEECVISAALKRRIERLKRKTGRTDIIQTCSPGITSRVNERTVDATVLQPTAPLPGQTTVTRAVRTTPKGRADVVLVTVTY
jgi:hypothetical protein